MKITKIQTFPITLPVRPEFYIVSSAGTHPVSHYLLVAIETDTGLVGWGEATVVPIWSGETQRGADALIMTISNRCLPGTIFSIFNP
jgi:L-alanine-DL-glutamate epimerase-like enolase superfamily enzyme